MEEEVSRPGADEMSERMKCKYCGHTVTAQQVVEAAQRAVDTELTLSAGSLKEMGSFETFGSFRYRFESLYRNAGKVRGLISQPREAMTAEWKAELQECIDAIADSIGPLVTEYD